MFRLGYYSAHASERRGTTNPFYVLREVTRAQGVPMVRCVCTSYYTHLAVARLGFQHVHTMPYKSFVDADGKVVFETEPPHENVETYVARV